MREPVASPPKVFGRGQALLHVQRQKREPVRRGGRKLRRLLSSLILRVKEVLLLARFINSESGECLRARLHSQALEDSRQAPALVRPQTRVLPPSPLPLLG